MRKTEPPTPQQIQALTNMGIIAPITKAACRNLLAWLLESDAKMKERIALLKSAQQKFAGKRVQHRVDRRIGVVRHILHNPDCATYFDAGVEKRNGPLDALVDWESQPKHRKLTRVVFSSLILL